MRVIFDKVSDLKNYETVERQTALKPNTNFKVKWSTFVHLDTGQGGIPVFSRSVFGVLGRLLIWIRGLRTKGMYSLMSAPATSTNKCQEHQLMAINNTWKINSRQGSYSTNTVKLTWIYSSTIDNHSWALPKVLQEGFSSLSVTYPSWLRFRQWPMWHCCIQRCIPGSGWRPGLAWSHLAENKPCKRGLEVRTERLPMKGFTCWKQAFVKSPSKAKELCRTSGIGSWKRMQIVKCSIRMFTYFWISISTGHFQKMNYHIIRILFLDESVRESSFKIINS